MPRSRVFFMFLCVVAAALISALAPASFPLWLENPSRDNPHDPRNNPLLPGTTPPVMTDSPSPTHSATPSASLTPTASPSATEAPTASQVLTHTATPTASPSPTATPTATQPSVCAAPARLGTPYGAGQFNDVMGICRDAAGEIYVADTLNDRIQVFDASGNYLSSYGTSGSANGQFNSPWSIAVDAGGNIYVLDAENHRVQKFDPSWNYLGGFGLPDDGSAAVNMISTGRGLTLDSSGNIFVSDYSGYRVLEYDASLNHVRTLGTGSFGQEPTLWSCYSTYDSTCPSCVLAGALAPPPQPAGTCLGDDGYNTCSGLYPCSSSSGGIGGEVENQFGGNWGVAYTPANATFACASTSAWNGPHTTTTGIIYVVDSYNDRIMAFDDATGGFLTQFGHSNDSPGTFYYPTGITVDQFNGEVYVAEYDRVEVFDIQGHFLRETPASATGLASGSGNGQVNCPSALVTDSTPGSPASYLYLADTYNHRIQRWSVGSGSSTAPAYDSQWGGTAGWGADTDRFYDPVGLATTSLGSGAGCGETFVVDAGNKVVKKFDSCGGFMMKFDETTVPAGPSGQPAGNWKGVIVIGTDPVDGSVYVVDAGNSRVVKYNGATGAYMLQFDGSLGSAGLMGWGWIDGKQWKTHVGGVAVDPATQNVWVSDSSHNLIQIFDKNGNFIDFFGGTGNGAGLFDNPSGIAIAGGSAYICDTGDRLIQKFDVVPVSPQVYTETAEWGGPVPPTGLPPTPPTAAALPPPLDYMNGPTGVAVDSLGRVYVSDTGWNRVIQTDSSGANPVLKAGNVNGWSGGAANEFRSPYGIAIDCSGNVLVVDSYNSRVVKLP